MQLFSLLSFTITVHLTWHLQVEEEEKTECSLPPVINNLRLPSGLSLPLLPALWSFTPKKTPVLSELRASRLLPPFPVIREILCCCQHNRAFACHWRVLLWWERFRARTGQVCVNTEPWTFSAECCGYCRYDVVLKEHKWGFGCYNKDACVPIAKTF